METRKIYRKPRLATRKIALGVFGDYNSVIPDKDGPIPYPIVNGRDYTME